MASSSGLVLSILGIIALCCLCMQGALAGNIVCENLNKEMCAFAVSSSGKRCVLEKQVQRRSLEEAYTCRTSEIEAADKFNDWIETEECIQACGLDRNTLGISSDSLLDSHFALKLCSTPCYHNCPNVVDLYFNLAVGEGVYLPKLCETRGAHARREMAEIRSSGFVAEGPESGGGKPVSLSISPAYAPGPESGVKITSRSISPASAPFAPAL